MDRLAKIILSAERTKINKHTEQHNKINCVPYSARISEKTCRINCARAVLTKKEFRRNNSNKKNWMNTNWLLSCLDCPKFKKPNTRELATVMTERNRINIGRKKNGQERDMARASSIERNLSKLHDHIKQISPPDNKESTTAQPDSGEYTETAQFTDIFDVGIPVEIDEIEK